MRRLAPILAATALLAGCGGAGTDTPEGATETFFKAVGDGDAGKACELVAYPVEGKRYATAVFGPMVRGTSGREGDPCEDVVAALPEKRRQQFSNVKIDGTAEVSGSEARVKTTFPAENDPDFTLADYTVKLDKAGDSWKVALIGG